MRETQVGDPRECCLIPPSLPPPLVWWDHWGEEGLSLVTGVGDVGACKTYGVGDEVQGKAANLGAGRGVWDPLGAELSLPPANDLLGLQISHCWGGTRRCPHPTGPTRVLLPTAQNILHPPCAQNCPSLASPSAALLGLPERAAGAGRVLPGTPGHPLGRTAPLETLLAAG